MRIGVIGGAGAMGSAIGAMLAEGGHDVTLVDVAEAAVNAVNERGLIVEEKSGGKRVVNVRAATDPMSVGAVDLALVFVKCYHTEPAVRSAKPMIGPGTVVLSLQNGWGNAERIADVLGGDRVLVGVTYHSATLLGPGHVLHAGRGATFIGDPERGLTDRVTRTADVLGSAGLDVKPTDTVLKEVWSKLALNACTLPTSALLRFTAGALVEHEASLALMADLLRETVAVACAQNIPMDYDERWEAITGLLRRAGPAKSSMLQDVEHSRHTEIDVINGAVARAGEKLGVLTPCNTAMVNLIKAWESALPRA